MNISSSKRHRAGGFMLLEFMIVMALVAFAAIYASKDLKQATDETLANGSAAYLQTVATAAQAHVLLNFSAYNQGTPVTGVASALQPTIPELAALGRLPTAFPSYAGAMPTKQTAQINITRTSCPGPSCSVTALVCTTTPVDLGTGVVRFDLASLMVSAQNGTGGQSLPGAGGTIRGAVLNKPNPIPGNPEGIVCASGVVDVGMYQSFVQINDTRDPNLQGPLTVGGPTTLKDNLSVAGSTTLTGTTTVGTCARILAATGRAGFGCADPNDLPAGYTGGVRSPDVVSSGSILASTAPAAFTGSNGDYAYVGVAGGVGEVRTSGRAQADRLVPAGAYAIGAVCTPADEGAIARDSGGTGLVTCRGGLWRALATFGVAGAACTPNGSLSDDGTGSKLLCLGGTWQPIASLWSSAIPGAACPNQGTVAYHVAGNNEMVVCRLNPAGGVSRWMRVRDVTTNLVFVQSYEVTDVSLGASGSVAKPTCTAAGGMSASAVIQLIPKIYSSADGGVALYAIDVGASWQVYLRNGNNGLLTGNPSARAIANVFCFFA